MSRYICVGYLICRIADTIEDAGHVDPAVQTELLAEYERVLRGEARPEAFVAAVDPWIPDDGGDDWAVVARTPRVLRAFRTFDEDARTAVGDPVRELVAGLRTFTDRYADEGGLRLQTVDELEEYCWYAAGTVGTLVTQLLTPGTAPGRTEQLRANARSFALLLQLVNVAKDVRRDYVEENNVYLPAEWLADAGVTVDDLTDPENADAVANVVLRVVDRAESYLDGAQRYLEAVPEHRGNTLSAWAIPYLLAVGTLRELRGRPADVIREGNVKVSRAEVHAVIQEFEKRQVSGEDVGTLRDEIAAGPLHE